MDHLIPGRSEKPNPHLILPCFWCPSSLFSKPLFQAYTGEYVGGSRPEVTGTYWATQWTLSSLPRILPQCSATTSAHTLPKRPFPPPDTAAATHISSHTSPPPQARTQYHTHTPQESYTVPQQPRAPKKTHRRNHPPSRPPTNTRQPQHPPAIPLCHATQ